MFKDFELPLLPTVFAIFALAIVLTLGVGEILEPTDAPASGDWMWHLMHWNW